MKLKPFILIAVLAVITLAGCSTPEGTPIVSGLHDVGTALASMKLGELEVLTNSVFVKNGTTNFSVGLFPVDFSYTFNVTSSRHKDNQLTISATASAPQIPVSGTLSDAYSAGVASARANQITINFASPFFTTSTITTTTTNTIGTNKVIVVETKVQRTVTNPEILAEFFHVIYGNTNGFAGNGGSAGYTPMMNNSDK